MPLAPLRSPRCLASLMLVLAVALPGCSGDRGGTNAPAAGPAGSGPVPASAGTPKVIPGGVATIAVIRLGDPLVGQEPIDADLDSGLQQAGVAPTAFKLVAYDADGDLKAVPGLIEKALAAEPDAVVTLLAETTVIAAGKTGKVPLFFSLVGDPALLGLGKNDRDHNDGLTGVYSVVERALIVPIARGCQPKAKAMGVLVRSDRPVSVAHKDALLQTDWADVKPLTATYADPGEIAKAVASLKEQKAEALILTEGLGADAKAAVAAARAAKLPVYGALVEHAIAGAILARPITPRWNGFELGRRIGRVLKGEPIKQVGFGRGDNFKTCINPGAAKEMGVTIIGGLMRDPQIVETAK